LPEAELRNQVVVTLLAILELARLKVVRVLQSPNGETLFITQATGVTIDQARQAALLAGDRNQAPVEEKPDARSDEATSDEEIRAAEADETLAEDPDEPLDELLADIPDDPPEETLAEKPPEALGEMAAEKSGETLEEKPEEMLEEKNEQT
jgi:hypothetical protein